MVRAKNYESRVSQSRFGENDRRRITFSDQEVVMIFMFGLSGHRGTQSCASSEAHPLPFFFTHAFRVKNVQQSQLGMIQFC